MTGEVEKSTRAAYRSILKGLGSELVSDVAVVVYYLKRVYCVLKWFESINHSIVLLRFFLLRLG